jgi:hypothetical protein
MNHEAGYKKHVARAPPKSLAVRKLHPMTIWIMKFTQITRIFIQKHGTEFQPTILVGLLD